MYVFENKRSVSLVSIGTPDGTTALAPFITATIMMLKLCQGVPQALERQQCVMGRSRQKLQKCGNSSTFYELLACGNLWIAALFEAFVFNILTHPTRSG